MKMMKVMIKGDVLLLKALAKQLKLIRSKIEDIRNMLYRDQVSLYHHLKVAESGNRAQNLALAKLKNQHTLKKLSCFCNTTDPFNFDNA